MIPPALLRRLRNDLPMPVAIANLGPAAPPAETFEGYFRFLCPRCGELRATANTRNNLAHGFCCGRNCNNPYSPNSGTYAARIRTGTQNSHGRT